MKNKTVFSGFTIVELLIVIVVIGILSTIVLVSYNGAQNSAKSQSAKTTASSLQRKIEAYASTKNNFPDETSKSAYESELNSLGDSSITSLDISVGAPNGTNGTTTVEVSQCNGNLGHAYRIRYWDFAKKELPSDVIYGYLGAATCANWTAVN